MTKKLSFRAGSSISSIRHYVKLPVTEVSFVISWLDLFVQSYKITEVLDYWTRDVKEIMVVFENQSDAEKFKEMLREKKL